MIPVNAGLPGPYLGFQLKHLGDFLSTLPALAFLKEKTGQKVGLVLTPQIASILTCRDLGSINRFEPQEIAPTWVDEVFVLDRRGGPGPTLKTVRSLRRSDYKTAFIFDGQTRSILAASLAGIENRCGAGGLYRPSLPLLYTDMFDIRDGQWSRESQAYRAQKMVAAALGLTAGPPKRPELEVLDEASRVRAQELLSSLKGPGPLIGLALKGLQPEKSWPLPYFAELARLLSRHFQARLFATGGPAESALARTLDRISGVGVADFCGATSLRELAALARLSDLYITIDTGTAHVVALTETPLISIYTWTSPALWPPLSPRARLMVYDWSLRRFGLSAQDGPWRSAPTITPEMVFKQAADLLAAAGK